MIVVKYHNQKQFMVEEFVLAYSSREVRIYYEGEVFQQEVGMVAGKRSRELTSSVKTESRMTYFLQEGPAI